MKQILPPHLVEILQTRVFISRTTKLLKIEQIAEGWKISRITLYRYDSPKYREQARLDAKEIADSQKGIDRSQCQICESALEGHLRCSYCTILIHGKMCDCEKREALHRNTLSPYTSLRALS